MENNQENLNNFNIKEYITEDMKHIQIAEINNVFNILFKQGLITQQEQHRAIDLANKKFK
jgi:hypothetical protein